MQIVVEGYEGQKIGDLGALLGDIETMIEMHRPDMILVMGSDFVPVLTPAAVDRLFPLALWRPRSIAEIGLALPILYFGAAMPQDAEVISNLYVALQQVRIEDVIMAVQSAFPRDTVELIVNPRYLIDLFFLDAFRKAYVQLRKTGAATFSFRYRVLFSQDKRAVARLKRSYERRLARGVRVITVGRMTSHMLAHTHNLMWHMPCLSSYAEDVSMGALLGYDNDEEACAQDLVSNFISPLLESRSVDRKTIVVDDRKVRG